MRDKPLRMLQVKFIGASLRSPTPWLAWLHCAHACVCSLACGLGRVYILCLDGQLTVSFKWAISNILAIYVTIKYQLPYSGKLSKEKTFTNWWKYDFRGENFCSAKGRHAPNFAEKTSAYIATKQQNSWKFSPSKVLRYTVCMVLQDDNIFLKGFLELIRRCMVTT